MQQLYISKDKIIKYMIFQIVEMIGHVLSDSDKKQILLINQLLRILVHSTTILQANLMIQKEDINSELVDM